MIKILSTSSCCCWKPFVPGSLSSAAVQGNNFRSMSRKIQEPGIRIKSKINNLDIEMEPRHARYKYFTKQLIETRIQLFKLRNTCEFKRSLLKKKWKVL